MNAVAERKPQLSKYDLLEEVGHGGMATVYRAVDRRLAREVAVKVIHRHLRENLEVAARFVSEARAVAKLKHPNIVEVYDVSDESEEDRYLIVELVRGRTLRELLRAQRFLPPEIAAAIALEVAAGLQHAHELGVIHRDVKPENVLIAEPEAKRGGRGDGREFVLAEVKITDFGIAKLLDAQGVTATGQVLGSPAHMAPEQIEGGPVSARADVFGLGVLVYESMVGRLPFEGNNPAQVLRRVLEGVFTVPERCRPTIGANYGRILSKALAHSPEDRYAEVAEFAAALRSELQRVGFTEPRRELSEFLANPDDYRALHQDRIVAQLASAASELRSVGDVPGAAALFNRALAYRPDDPELLRAVTGIARAERVRRVLRRTAISGAVLVGVLAAGFGVARSLGGNRAGQVASAAPQTAAPSGRTRTAAAPRDAMSAQPKTAAPGVVTSNPDPRLARGSAGGEQEVTPRRPRAVVSEGSALPRAPAAVSTPTPATRKVRVHISGAGGGKLLIDGQPREWFGVELELTEGPHTVQFVAPSDQCCVAPPPQVIVVAPGSGPQQIHGHIEFRDAGIRLTGRSGSVLRCAELFPGELAAPGERNIPMNQPVLSVSCTLISPPESGHPPKAIDVTLRPGGVFSIEGS